MHEENLIDSKNLKQKIMGIALSILGSIGLQIILSIILTVILLVGLNSTNPNVIVSSKLYVLFSYITYTISMLTIIFLTTKTCKINFSSILNKIQATKHLSTLSYASIGVAGLCLGALFSFLFQKFLSLFNYNLSDLNLEFSNDPLSITLLFLFVGILPGLLEELIFRGVILSYLSKYNTTYAIIISAFFFAITHSTGTQFFATFIGGIALAFITIKSNSLLPAILAHMFNNSIAVFTMIVEKYYLEFSNIISIILSFIWISAIIYAIIVFIKNKNLLLNIPKKECTLSNKQLYSATFANVGMILLIIIQIASIFVSKTSY